MRGLKRREASEKQVQGNVVRGWESSVVLDITDFVLDKRLHTHIQLQWKSFKGF